MWNFYEWADGLSGWLGAHEKANEDLSYDLVLNTLLSIALSRLMSINDRLGKDSYRLTIIKEKLNEAINSYFYNESEGLYETRKGSGHYSILANSLAILSLAADKDTAKRIAEKLLVHKGVVDVSLSMRTFYYDALLLVDREKYKEYVLADIERLYTPMLECGNGTVWETVLGESDFDNAGSMCHGWSAIPIYYYNMLK
jgi:hypothetical protein